MLNRRDLARLLTAAGITAAVSPSTRAAETSRTIIKPRRLREGDTIGMVLPASMELEPQDIEMAREQLEAVGFKVRLGAHAYDRWGFLAGRDRDRAADINAAFADPEIDGIFAYTGGWGSPRLLPWLDWPLIAANPKVLVGFSDITALINAVHQRTGLVTFHGPVGASNFEPYTLDYLRRALMSDEPIGVIENPEKSETELVQRQYRTWTLRGGSARGRIVGGNLTLLAAMMGTPFEVDTAGGLLFLEDTHEAPYRIDRMLTQLGQGGKFRDVAGVVWGTCTDCRAAGPTLSWDELLRDHFEDLGVPVMVGFAFGHIAKRATLPIGLDAVLDADARTVTVSERATTG